MASSATIKLENRTQATLGVVGVCLLDPGLNEIEPAVFAALKAHKCGDVPYLKALAKEGKIGFPPAKSLADEPAGG